MNKTFVGIVGIAFIVLGVLGSVGWIVSFDWTEWNSIKDLTATYEIEIAMMKEERTTVFMMATVTLIGCVAVGAVMMALDRIIGALEYRNREARRNEEKLIDNTKGLVS